MTYRSTSHTSRCAKRGRSHHPRIQPASRFRRGVRMPDVPALVLTGDLDTITTPAEGDQAAALFRNARRVIVENTGHVSAVGDPYGLRLGDRSKLRRGSPGRHRRVRKSFRRSASCRHSHARSPRWSAPHPATRSAGTIPISAKPQPPSQRPRTRSLASKRFLRPQVPACAAARFRRAPRKKARPASSFTASNRSRILAVNGTVTYDTKGNASASLQFRRGHSCDVARHRRLRVCEHYRKRRWPANQSADARTVRTTERAAYTMV